MVVSFITPRYVYMEVEMVKHSYEMLFIVRKNSPGDAVRDNAMLDKILTTLVHLIVAVGIALVNLSYILVVKPKVGFRT